MQLTNPLLKKPNDAVVMFPKIGKLTAYGRKFYVSLMREAQQHLISKATKGEVFEATDFFKEPLTNIIRPISKPSSNLIDVTKQYITEMQSTRVEWSAPDADAKVIWDSMVLVSQAKIELENGRLYLLWAFPPDMVNALKDPKRFTLIAPEDLVNLKSYAAVALYEICARYADNLSQRTSRKPKEWWVTALCGDSHKTSARSKETGKPREWRKFKNESVIPAINEINQQTGLLIELIEIKQGRAVADVQFKVVRKANLKIGTSEAHLQAAQLGIPTQDITNFLNNGGTQDEALLHLASLRARVEDKDNDKVENRSSFFRGIIKKSRQEIKTSSPQGALRENKPSQKDMFSGEAKQVVSASALMNEHVLSLSDEEWLPLLEQVKQMLAAKDVLTPSLAKRIAEKNWRSGTIFHTLVNLYASQNFGSHWKDMTYDEISMKLKTLML